MCWSLCFGMHKAYGHGDGCEVMHVCARFLCSCELVYARCDCCEAMHAHACVCVFLCKRHIVTMLSAKRCMCVLKCVF
jgi:hypothetical protein